MFNIHNLMISIRIPYSVAVQSGEGGWNCGHQNEGVSHAVHSLPTFSCFALPCFLFTWDTDANIFPWHSGLLKILSVHKHVMVQGLTSIMQITTTSTILKHNKRTDKGTSWNVGLLWIPGSLNFTGTAILRKHWKHVCSAHCTAPNLASESQANAFLGPYMQLSCVNPNSNTSSGDQSCKCQPSHKTSSGFVLRPASHTWKGLVTAGLSKSKSHFKSPECLVISPSVC